MCELSIYQIAITKQYRVPEFREDLKTLYSIAGVENKPTSFLFNDTQVVEEQFLEIVNNMLSTGEVANLYKSDEMEDVSRLITLDVTIILSPFRYNANTMFLYRCYCISFIWKISKVKQIKSINKPYKYVYK